MKVTISRSHWLRAEGLGMGQFCDGDGNYCALGFVLSQAGLPDSALLDKGSIVELPNDLVRKHVPSGLYEDLAEIGVVSADVVSKITDANDDPLLTDHEREEDISMYLSRAGVDVTFTE
jgi:hypothetical protein